MAKRYTQETKDEVVDFVREFNRNNGRGGQSAAVAKWELNPLTVKAWLDRAGIATPGKRATKIKSDKSSAKKSKSKFTAVPDSDIAVLKRMAEIKESMAALQSEYESLKLML